MKISSLFFKKKKIYYSFFILAVVILLGFFLWSQWKQTITSYKMCNQPYALCTSAKCVPNPKNYNQTICNCDIEHGNSIGTKSCDQLKGYREKNVNYIFSTFSPLQSEHGRKVLNCGKEYPWSTCLNQKCEIDPQDKTKAICACDLVQSDKDWITFGKKPCANNYYSGAYMEDYKKTMDFWNKNQ